MSYGNNAEEKIDIEIIYKPIANEKLRIFGNYFVKNNKNNCKIIYKDKEYELKEYFEDINNNCNSNEIILILRIINNITDVSCMFYDCTQLYSFPDIPQLNCSNINDMSDNENDLVSSIDEQENVFYNIYGKNEELIPIPSTLSSIKKDNTIFDNTGISEILQSGNKLSLLINLNVNNISYMFYECNSLISLPDISKLNTSNVKNMVCMFSGCNSLISLPDISKWNTSNVKNMNFMFYHCNSLISLPDISKWNISNVNDMSYMFTGCNSLISLPDISKWNTSNVKDMSHMFYRCNSLISLPDISKWNASNIEDMSGMFKECFNCFNIPIFPD